MALGLNRFTRNTGGSIRAGVTLKQLLSDPAGFPQGYLPQSRILDGVTYIRTFGKGRDADNMPVYYKWIFIDPADNSATSDSDVEFAKIPEKGFIMRITQRNLLPYHENFVIDYYEDIENINVVSCSENQKNQWANRTKNVYRQFRLVNADPSKSHIPNELVEEIFSYPKEFFEQFIKDVIPADMYWTGNGSGGNSNHISSYGSTLPGTPSMNLGSINHSSMSPRGFQRNSMMGGGRPSMDANAHRNRMSNAMNRINQSSGYSQPTNNDNRSGQYNRIDSPDSPIRRFQTW